MKLKPNVPAGATPRQVIEACGGFYSCPKTADGKRLGPMVAFAGTYLRGARKMQYVGDDFSDFSKIEEWPEILHDHVTAKLILPIQEALGFGPFVLCGVPEGGKGLAFDLSEWMGMRYAFPEKIKLETGVEGEERPTKFVFGRHRIYPGDRVIIVEDTCNNFSSTLKLIREIESAGGTVVAVACFLNRSPKFRETYEEDGIAIPIIARWNEAFPEYEQDDPFVKDDIASVERRPKDRIEELVELMKKQAQAPA